MYHMAWGTDVELNDYEFYNRTEDIEFISNLLKGTTYGSSPTILLTGIRGVGKTALIKKLEKNFKEDYLVTYIDISQNPEYQENKLKRIDIIKLIYKKLIESCDNFGLNTINKKLEKYIKTNNIHVSNITQYKNIPLPLIETEKNQTKLIDFVMELPQQIYEENKNKIKGVLLFFDEIQVIKDLDEDLNSFLWYLRNKTQTQKNVSYLFSGSMSVKDTLIMDMVGQNGAFGGRILTIEIKPFTQQTTTNYLNEKANHLKLTEDGIEQFYKCTHGIPAYINIFANLLPPKIILDANEIKKQFKNIIPVLITSHLIQWGKLTLREQKIITNLLEKPLKRLEISEKLKVKSGSLGKPLNHLMDLALIEYDNGKYQLIDPVFKAWLKNTYEEKGLYPYRSMI
ncbi:ATP-binding protein [Methanosphaera sp. WGK6]|uniref:AAA family ATPase n=1 Tax=Methanosphaera sp. WGK6 TaxID=1561964 RepID=UPI00084CD2EB|nr:ATP-binding protein [Methanosphaera sp. WGK6]OED30397.1 ATPase [Methanosphaera sp. WGK6]